jgi:hypothetical protein
MQIYIKKDMDTSTVLDTIILPVTSAGEKYYASALIMMTPDLWLSFRLYFYLLFRGRRAVAT